ncbi:MAG TPA: type IV secretion protein Rhs, partial [bacterium]|nr:type IV secretion protein Rhs [bacterium]
MNRLTKTVDGVETVYIYDANDRMTSDGTKTYSYDSNGNMLSDGVNSYAYNYDNRMISAGNAEYSYNTSGIRTEKIVNSETTKYIVDMNESFPRVVEELDSLNNLSVRYEAGEKIISQTKDGQISFFLYDGFGSTRILTDLSGTSTDLYEYDAYGNITTQ